MSVSTEVIPHRPFSGSVWLNRSITRLERHLQVPLLGPESQACPWELCDKQAEFCPFQAWFYWQRHKTQLETKCFFCSVINRLIHRQSTASAFSPFSAGTICSGSLVDLLIVFQWRTESKMKSLHLHSHKQMATAQDKACNQRGDRMLYWLPG